MVLTQRLNHEGIVRFLECSTLFDGMNRADLEAVAHEVESLYAEAGTTVMRQKEAGDCLYIVVRGRLRALYRQENGEEQVVGEICRGETVGEMALLDGEPRSTDVVAVRDTHLLRLSKIAFDRLVEKRPLATMHLARMIARRLRDTVRRRSQPTRRMTLAIVSTGVPQVADFTRRLVQCLSPYGRVFSASSNVMTRGASDIDGWMDDRETENEFVLFQCDESATSWSVECLRHADRVLVVMGDNGSPEPSEIERMCATGVVRTELVLLHENRHPEQTQRFLAARNVTAHHHVNLRSGDDIQRIARAIAGRSMGLVLSGGGARGFAQIGAIRALQEKGVPIDVIGGASIGAVVGGLFAQGKSVDEMTDMCRNMLVLTRAAARHADPSAPLVSIIDSEKAVEAVNQLMGDAQIEDLWLRYFCVSSNLSRGKVEVHNFGPLARWVRASSSAPGAAPPLFEKDDLLVDGGVMNSLPADVMRTVCEGSLIGVDVCDRVDPRTSAAFTGAPNRLGSLWNWLAGPKRQETPGFVNALTRNAMMTSAYEERAAKQSVEMYLRPPVEQFSGLAWQEIERFVEIGYHYSTLIVEKWLEQNGRVWEK